MKIKNNLFYIAYILNLIYVLQYHSIIMKLPGDFTKILVILTYVFFALKFLLDKHTIKKIFIYLMLAFLFLYFYRVTKVQYIFVAYLAIICLKDVDIKKLLKIDIFVRGLFLLIHFVLFGADYLFFDSNIVNMISTSVKGVSYYLYFDNPNIVSEFFFTLVLEILYLRKNLKFLDYVISFILMYLMFVITKSRTSFAVFIIYLLLNLIKNKNIVYYLSKYMYIVMAVISWYIVKYVQIGSSLYERFNDLSTNRMKFSILAFKETGLTIFPKSNTIIQNYIIDNFYVRCFICYGILILILTYLIHYFSLKKENVELNKIVISLDVYLMFEQVVTNIAYNPILLILSDKIVNREDTENEVIGNNSVL